MHAMATEVSLIMSKMAGHGQGGAHAEKMARSLENVLAWLDGNLSGVLEALPEDRDLSYLEASLYCLVTHLEFREVVPTSQYPALKSFSDRFGARSSAADTPYRFDAR